MKSEHGLSLFIESNGKKILFDTGKSALFFSNAEKMGIDLSQVDVCVISHGHFDHGGGLKRFLEVNKKAKIYLHRQATGAYYTKILGGFIPYYIGLKKSLLDKNQDRFHYIETDMLIADDIQIIENIPHEFPLPKGNLSLFEKKDKQYIHDRFRHEIVMLIKENDKAVVFTGCSHSGILNMVQKAKNYIKEETLAAVLGGFHTYNPVTKENESDEYLNNLAVEMLKHQTNFYTGHCTGEYSFTYLKEKMAGNLQMINTGTVIEL